MNICTNFSLCKLFNNFSSEGRGHVTPGGFVKLFETFLLPVSKLTYTYVHIMYIYWKIHFLLHVTVAFLCTVKNLAKNWTFCKTFEVVLHNMSQMEEKTWNYLSRIGFCNFVFHCKNYIPTFKKRSQGIKILHRQQAASQNAWIFLKNVFILSFWQSQVAVTFNFFHFFQKWCLKRVLKNIHTFSHAAYLSLEIFCPFPLYLKYEHCITQLDKTWKKVHFRRTFFEVI